MEINGVVENIVKILIKTFPICVVSAPEKIKLLTYQLVNLENLSDGSCS